MLIFKKYLTQLRWLTLSPEFLLNYFFHVGALKTVLTTQIDQVDWKLQKQ